MKVVKILAALVPTLSILNSSGASPCAALVVVLVTALALRNSYISPTRVPLITTGTKYILNIIYNTLQCIRHRKATMIFKE